jgi:hypothetical protein
MNLGNARLISNSNIAKRLYYYFFKVFIHLTYFPQFYFPNMSANNNDKICFNVFYLLLVVFYFHEFFMIMTLPCQSGNSMIDSGIDPINSLMAFGIPSQL